MITIFLKAIKEKRITLLVYSLSSIAFVWMYVALFPSIRDSADQLMDLMKAYPESLLKAFGFEETAMMFSSVEGFISTEYFSFLWPIITIIFAISLAGNSLAGEIEKGTMETVLAQPVSRTSVFLGKYLAGLVMILVFTIVSIMSIPLTAKLYNISYVFKSYILISGIGFILAMAIYSIAFFFSSVFSEKGKVYLLSGGLMVLMYVFNIVSALKENLEDLQYFSFFHYFNSMQILVNNKIENLAYFVFIGCIIIFSSLAFFRFIKRDIST